MESALTGEPVVALCGKVWTPGRDPKKFPVCPECKDVYDGLRPEGDGGKGPGGKRRGQELAGPATREVKRPLAGDRPCPELAAEALKKYTE